MHWQIPWICPRTGVNSCHLHKQVHPKLSAGSKVIITGKSYLPYSTQRQFLKPDHTGTLMWNHLCKLTKKTLIFIKSIILRTGKYLLFPVIFLHRFVMSHDAEMSFHNLLTLPNKFVLLQSIKLTPRSKLIAQRELLGFVNANMPYSHSNGLTMLRKQ